MTIEEIFNKIASHMVEGIMYHDEMAKAYDFLSLSGFSKCQDYHHLEETKNYRLLSHYYATHYYKLLQLEEFTKPKLISDTWYKYTAWSVDVGTKRSAIKELITKWIEWERSTKKLYQEMRIELDKIGELDASQKIDECIHNVSHELYKAEKLALKLETIGYDLITIQKWSDHLYKKYKKKIGW